MGQLQGIKVSLEPLLCRHRQGQQSSRLFIVSGPSGAGKTVLCKEVERSIPNLLYSISYTTRSRRRREVVGHDYFFLSPDEFQSKIERGDFLEWAKVHGNYYGTCRHWVKQKLAEGRDIILDIDVQGAEQIRRQALPSCSIFVVPPSLEILKQRLLERASNAASDIAQRLKNAEKEIKSVDYYQYLIVNDKLAEAVEQLVAIIKAQGCRAP